MTELTPDIITKAIKMAVKDLNVNKNKSNKEAYRDSLNILTNNGSIFSRFKGNNIFKSLEDYYREIDNVIEQKDNKIKRIEEILNNKKSNLSTYEIDKLENEKAQLEDEKKQLKKEKDIFESNKRKIEKETRRNTVSGGIVKIEETISGVLNKWSNLVVLSYEFKKNEIELTKINASQQIKSLNIANKQYIEQVNKTVSSGLSMFTKTANEAALDAYNSIQDIAMTNVKSSIEQYNLSKQSEFQREENRIQSTNQENEAIEKVGGIVKDVSALASKLPGAVGAAFNGIGAVAGIITSIATARNKREIAKSQAALESEKATQEIAEQFQTMFSDTLEGARTMIKSISDLASKTYEGVGKFDTSIRDMGATIGFYNKEQGNKLAETYRQNAKEVSSIFGKEAENIVKLQSQYINTSGRAVNLTSTDFNQIMSTSRVMGISDNESTDLYANMNIFNTSIDSGYKMVGKMYNTLTKAGLSTAKFSKDLANNLQKAQKYNFKGGLENMMKMTKWAQQTRFNLDTALNFAEGLMGGDISKGLEKSARLQVLGGNAAIYSDPIGMLYDAYQDPESLAKRMKKMTEGFGTWDANTGSYRYSTSEEIMLRQIAQAFGTDVGELKKSSFEEMKQQQLSRYFRGKNIDSETQEAIANRATYDTESKTWVLTDINKEKHSINEVVNNPSILKDILPENQNDAMFEIAKQSLSSEREMENLLANIDYTLQDSVYGNYQYNTSERMRIERDNIGNNINNVTEFINEVQKQETKAFEENTKNFSEYSGKIREVLNLYDNFLDNIGKITVESLNNIVDTLKKLKKYGWNVKEASQLEAIEIFGINKDKAKEERKNSTHTRTGSGAKWLVNKSNDLIPGGDIVENTNGSSYNYFDSTMGQMKRNVGINDGLVNIKTHPNDQHMFAKPNGPIDKLFDEIIPMIQNNSVNNMNIGSNIRVTFDGGLELRDTNGGRLDILDALKRDSVSLNNLTRMIVNEVSKNANGKTKGDRNSIVRTL